MGNDFSELLDVLTTQCKTTVIPPKTADYNNGS